MNLLLEVLPPFKIYWPEPGTWVLWICITVVVVIFSNWLSDIWDFFKGK